MHTVMLVLALVLATIAGRGYSQPNPPPNPQSNPDAVPITGIEYLLAAGALYGAYRIRFSLKPSTSRNSPPPSPAYRQPGHNS